VDGLWGEAAVGGVTTDFVLDGLGSVVGELDGDGNVDGKRAYDVFGAVRWSEGTDTTGHKFVGSLGQLVCPRAKRVFSSQSSAHNQGCGYRPHGAR